MHNMSSNKPKTLFSTQNSIKISWNNNIVDKNTATRYILQMCNDIKEWHTIYWGPKLEFSIGNLNSCSCYEFRIKEENSNEWRIFKAATADAPHITRHMTRAVKFTKWPLIRKIAYSKPLLLEAENKEGKTPLIQAIEADDQHLVNFLINLGANVNTPTLITRRTPLMIAIYNNRQQIASHLIDKRCNIFATDINNLNILHYAVDSNCLESVQFALRAGIDIESKDRSGWTALLRAVVLECDEEIVNYLIENGASTSIRDKNGLDFVRLRKISGT